MMSNLFVRPRSKSPKVLTIQCLFKGWLLNFSDRTRTGVFNMIWPLDNLVTEKSFQPIWLNAISTWDFGDGPLDLIVMMFGTSSTTSMKFIKGKLTFMGENLIWKLSIDFISRLGSNPKNISEISVKSETWIMQ